MNPPQSTRVSEQASDSRQPRSPLLNFNDGGGGGVLVTEVHILYPKKSQLQNLSTQKNHYFFRNPKKSQFFFVTQKNPTILNIDPKKLLLAKISDPKKSLGPPLSLKYVSGAPGPRSM